MSDTFQPGDVFLVPHAPLCATFGKSELEQAGALIVLALQHAKSDWRAVAWSEIQAAAHALPPHDEKNRWFRNPFFKPDVHKLVSEGFAAWEGEPGGPVAFTPKGIEALRKWKRES